MAGERGLIGEAGLTGLPGADGRPGLQGKPGLPGKRKKTYFVSKDEYLIIKLTIFNILNLKSVFKISFRLICLYKEK